MKNNNILKPTFVWAENTINGLQKAKGAASYIELNFRNKTTLEDE